MVEAKRPAVICPYCGHQTDLTTPVSDSWSIPSEGDVSMCIHCGEFAVFTERAEELRLPTPSEASEMLLHPDAARAREAWRWLMRQGND